MSINKQDALKRLDAIENEAAELRKIINAPEASQFEIGTFGEFWDCEKYGKYGYLRKIDNDLVYFHMDGLPYHHFEPITEAILPPWIEHDGGLRPSGLSEKDRIEYDWEEGNQSGNNVEYVGNLVWPNITRYRIIKRAEK